MADGTPEPAIEGPAFPLFVKGLAALLMAGLAGYGLQASAALFGRRPNLTLLAVVLVLAVVATVCFWWMLVSRTRISPTHIRQTWWSDKSVAIADITQTKLILVPYLTWLIAPRLVVRTRAPGAQVFHAADPRLIAAFARLSIGLPALP